MGYVYDVRENNGIVTVLVTMPHRGRAVYEFLVTAGGGRVEPGIRERLLKLKGVQRSRGRHDLGTGLDSGPTERCRTSGAGFARLSNRRSARAYGVNSAMINAH